MLDNRSFSEALDQPLSDSGLFGRSARNTSARSTSTRKTDNTFASAKTIGTLRASSSPVVFKFKGELDRKDRDDFVKLNIEPGASFSSTKTQLKFKDGSLRVTSFFALPGGTPQKVSEFKFGSGNNEKKINSPVSNPFGQPVQIYVQIRTLKPSKDIFYNASLTFTPL